jgi:hypothetical protein
VQLHNIVSVDPAPTGDGWRFNRVPAALWPKLNEAAQKRSFSPAGAELRFNLPRGEARIVLRFLENDRGNNAHGLPVLAEVYYGDYFVRWVEIGTDWTEIAIAAPDKVAALAAAEGAGGRRFDPALVRLALPYMPEVDIRSIDGDFEPVRADQLPAKRYLAYGSSITNGAFAVRPGDLYPARVAAELGVDHFNLGFGGGAHLEAEMGAWIASRSDWEFATLEMGINLVGRLTPEQFRERVQGFLPPIARAHPDRWIFCIDMFTAHGDFDGNAKYPAFRAIVREAVRALDQPKVVHLDGRKLLTRASGLTLDFTHPSSNGFAEIADHLLAEMRPRVQGT